MRDTAAVGSFPSRLRSQDCLRARPSCLVISYQATTGQSPKVPEYLFLLVLVLPPREPTRLAIIRLTRYPRQKGGRGVCRGRRRRRSGDGGGGCPAQRRHSSQTRCVPRFARQHSTTRCRMSGSKRIGRERVQVEDGGRGSVCTCGWRVGWGGCNSNHQGRCLLYQSWHANQ